MKQKFSLFYFFLTFLNSLACYGISSISYAASVIITENINTPASQILSQPEINFLTTNLLAKINQPQPSITNPQKSSHSKQQTQNLIESAKQLIAENQENNFIHDSIQVYTEAKLIIDETDTLLNILTQDLFLTFGVDQQIHNELIALQLNSSSNIGQSSLTSVIAYEDEKTKNLLSTANLDFSNSQIREEFKNTLFGKLFVINNIYYLVGVMLFISLLLKILKYVLINHK